MFLQDKQDGSLIKIEDPRTLFDPNESKISGRNQSGEEEQNLADYEKTALQFPSGEELPRCWIDVDFRTTPSL